MGPFFDLALPCLSPNWARMLDKELGFVRIEKLLFRKPYVPFQTRTVRRKVTMRGSAAQGSVLAAASLGAVQCPYFTFMIKNVVITTQLCLERPDIFRVCVRNLSAFLLWHRVVVLLGGADQQVGGICL